MLRSREKKAVWPGCIAEGEKNRKRGLLELDTRKGKGGLFSSQKRKRKTKAVPGWPWGEGPVGLAERKEKNIGQRAHV